MIPRISRGSSARAALAYDFGPGRREEHVNARTVAGNVPGTWRDQAQMIDETVAARPRVEKGIWRTSLRAAPEDRVLSDEEWGRIASSYIAAMGLSAHPWTATRHGNDHIHLTVSRVSWEGRVASLSHDFAKAQAACRAIEVELHLVDASTRFDRDRPQISHGERERAARLAAAGAAGAPVQPWRAVQPGVPGQLVPGREKEQLRELVTNATTLAAATQSGREGFEEWLTKFGVAFRCNVASTGRVSGYSYGLPGHIDAGDEQVFFKGSQLGKAHAWAATSAMLTATADHRVDRRVDDRVDRRADDHVDHHQHHGAALRAGPHTHKRVQERATAAPGTVEELVEKPVAQPARRAVEQPGSPAAEQPVKQPVQEPAAQVHLDRLLAEHQAVLAQRQQLTRQRLEATTSHQSSLAALQAARRVLEVASRSHRNASSDWQELARQVQRTTAAITELIAAGRERSAARRAREQLASPWAALGGRPTAAAQRAAALEAAQRAGEVAQARELTGRARVVQAEGAVQVAHQQVSAAQVEADRTGKVVAAATVREQRALTQVTAWEVEQARQTAPSPLVQQALDRARGRGPGLGHRDPWSQSPGRNRGSGPSR